MAHSRFRGKSTRRPKTAPRGVKRNADKVKALSRKVRKIERAVKTDTALHTVRVVKSSRLNAPQNQSGLLNQTGNDISEVESALSNLRYYDPSNPTVLQVADFTSGTFSKEILVKAASSSIDIRNNYRIPCECRVYICEPKSDTSLTPTTTFTNGMADQGNPLTTSINAFPTDSEQFNAIWRVKKVVKRTLKGGDQFSVSHNSGSFIYDPSVADSHALNFQSAYKPVVFLVRVQGIISHDDAAVGNQGTNEAAVDVLRRIKYVFQYDAGTSLNDFTYDDTLNTMAAGAVITQFSTTSTTYNES